MQGFSVDWPRLTEFQGRDELLEAIHTAVLRHLGGQQSVVLSGEEGVGKTQVAVEYAYRYRDAYPGGVYWINARRDWTQELAELARQMGLKPLRTAVSTVEQERWLVVALQRHLATQPEQATLFILDNVVNPRHIADREVGQGVHLADLGVYLLVTAQADDATHIPDTFQQLPVEAFSLDDACQMVQAVRPDSDPTALCQAVRCFPLTLGVIRKTLELYPDASVDDLLGLLHPDDDPLDRLLSWHYEHLELREAHELLALAAAFQRETVIPLVRLRMMTGFARGVFDSAIDVLAASGWIEVLGHENIALHSRICRFIRATLPEFHEPLKDAINRLLTALYDPATFYQQVTQRGVNAVLTDLNETYIAAIETGSPPYELIQFHRLLEWEADHAPEQILQQLRERAHHQQVFAIRNATDSWLAGRPHFATLAPWHYPRNPSVLRTYIGHEDRINDVVALDAQQVLTASQDGLLRLWDLYAGQTLRFFRGHTSTVTCLALLTPDIAISGSSDHTVRVWDLQTGEQLRVLEGHLWPITTVVPIGDRQVLSGSADDTLRLWDLQTGETVRVFQGHSEPVTAAIRWRKHYLLSAAHDATIRLWNLDSGETAHVFIGHESAVTALAGIDSAHFISASADQTLRLWEVESGQCVQVYRGHTGSVTDVLALDSQVAVSASVDRTLRVWDVATGATLRILPGHTRTVTALALVGEHHIVSTSADLTLRLWDVLASHPDMETARMHTDWVMAVAGLEAPYAVSASADRTICVWNRDTAQVVRDLRGHEDGVNAIAVIKGNRFVTGSSDTLIRQWDLQDGAGTVMHGHRDEVTSLALIDEYHLVSGSSDRTVRLWNLRAGQTGRVLEGHADRVTAVARVSERLALSGSSDTTLRLWDLRLGNTVRVFEGHSATVRALVMRGDSQILSASNDRTIRLWDLNTGQTLAVLEGHTDWVTALISLGRDYYLSASFDRTLRLWNMRTLQTEARLVLEDPLLSLADMGDGCVMVGDLGGKVQVIRVVM